MLHRVANEEHLVKGSEKLGRNVEKPSHGTTTNQHLTLSAKIKEDTGKHVLIYSGMPKGMCQAEATSN